MTLPLTALWVVDYHLAGPRKCVLEMSCWWVREVI